MVDHGPLFLFPELEDIADTVRRAWTDASAYILPNEAVFVQTAIDADNGRVVVVLRIQGEGRPWRIAYHRTQYSEKGAYRRVYSQATFKLRRFANGMPIVLPEAVGTGDCPRA